MPLRNRVTPYSELVAYPERGSLMGNRGVLHDEHRRIVRFSRGRRWIACLTEFRGRRRAPMTPGRYTELFFLDEATALAAGHRPCHECRRDDLRRFQTAWRRAFETAYISASAIDRVLHKACVDPRTRRQIRFEAALDELPDGAFVVRPDDPSPPLLILGERLLPWHPFGYRPPCPRPATARCLVLTPRPTVAVLRAGYRPALHPTATRG
jgi:hypothetical protein